MKKYVLLLALIFACSSLNADYGTGDNLGNHKAERALNMNNLDINNIDTVKAVDMTLSSRACAAQLYALHHASVTIVDTADVYEFIAGTSTLCTSSAWFNLIPNGNGVSNRLSYAGTNTHKFSITVQGCINSADNATTIAVKPFKDGVACGCTQSESYIGAQTQDTTLGFNGIMSFATGEYLDIMVTTDDGDDVILGFMQVTLIPID